MNADGTPGIDQKLARSRFLISARPLASAMVFAGALALCFGALYVLAGWGSDDRSPAVDLNDLAPY